MSLSNLFLSFLFLTRFCYSVFYTPGPCLAHGILIWVDVPSGPVFLVEDIVGARAALFGLDFFRGHPDGLSQSTWIPEGNAQLR